MKTDVQVKVVGWPEPLTVTVDRQDDVDKTVFCRVKESREGKTDGCSYADDKGQTDEEHAKAHIKWLGQKVQP